MNWIQILFGNWKLTAAAILGVWAFPPAIARLLTGSWSTAGQVGDSFGLANSLVSSLALLGVLYTLHLQRTESARRDAEIKADQSSASEQIRQLSLATRLQVCQALIHEHRRSIVELNPSVVAVPTASSLLKELRNRIERDSISNATTRKHSAEVIALIDDLHSLQIELIAIRQQFAAAAASQEHSR